VQRIGPDQPQALPHLRPAQIVEVDAEGPAVGELDVVAALAGEVGIGLDHVADIADQDERRPPVIGRQGTGIVLGLAAGVQHQHVPGAGGIAHAAPLRLQPWQSRLRHGLGAAGLA
jgi:hypothetical protein